MKKKKKKFINLTETVNKTIALVVMLVQVTKSTILKTEYVYIANCNFLELDTIVIYICNRIYLSIYLRLYLSFLF